MSIGTFLFLTIDATDAERAAEFWAAVLGTERDGDLDDGRFLLLKGREDLPVVCIQRVPESKGGTKNRVHLDLSVDDLDEATERIIDLGGAWPDRRTRELEGFSWRTLTDPEGNEFDIATGG